MVCEACQAEYNPAMLNQVLGHRLYRDLSEQTMHLQADENAFKCANCDAMFITQAKQILDRDFYCLSCKKKTCRLCGKLPHPGACEERQKLLTSLNLIESFGVCPNCLLLWGKDEHCDYVICIQCKIEFCFTCSALRDPTMKHGSQHHRKHCPHYSFLEENQISYVADCSECKKVNNIKGDEPHNPAWKPCPQPRDLVNHDLPIEECPPHLKYLFEENKG